MTQPALGRRQFLRRTGVVAAGTALGALVGPSAIGHAAPRRRGVPQPTGFLVTRWAADPFAHGSYSYLGVGASNADRRALAVPVDGQLFFAGEATSAGHAATVHGAYRSGRRAAQQVIGTSVRSGAVLVVGAGVAGLTAARDLARAGHQVTVVEGRDRLGGRIHTSRDLGLPLDLGASWIHGIRGNPVAALARRAGVPMEPTDYDNSVLYLADGTRASARVEREIDTSFRYLLREVEGPRESLDTDISLGDAIDRIVARDPDWDTEELAALDHAFNVHIEHETAGDVDELSLFWWDAAAASPVATSSSPRPATPGSPTFSQPRCARPEGWCSPRTRSTGSSATPEACASSRHRDRSTRRTPSSRCRSVCCEQAR